VPAVGDVAGAFGGGTATAVVSRIRRPRHARLWLLRRTRAILYGVSTECDRIADQLYRAVEGDAWHGPPMRALLADVSPEAAAAHPVPGAHSIWELVLHVTAWADAARRGLAGEVVELSEAEDWPAIGSVGHAEWCEATAALERAHAELRRVTMALGDGHLEDRTPGKPYTLYVLLHGIVQHTLYHGGQVALLKRAAASAR
jgi:hypothetical protein